MESIPHLIVLVAIVFTTISSAILGMRMRRRIKRTLGSQPNSELELTSLSTWMKVENIEEENQGGKLR